MEIINDILEREFERRGPWYTAFIINGNSYGGKFPSADDERIQMFFEAFPDASKILDLGILEGGLTFELAKKPGVSVIGIEGRKENIGRASFIKELLGFDNVQLVLADLEKEELDWLGPFDAVFCSGTLYHLPRPWELIAKLSRVTSNLFIWTRYAPEKDAMQIVENEYRGVWYQEPLDAASGLSPKSFWPTIGSLYSMIWQNGFTHITLLEIDPYRDFGPCVSLAARKYGESSKSSQANLEKVGNKMATHVEKIVEDYVAALNAHDVERIASFFTDDGIFENVPAGRVHRGKEGVKTGFNIEFIALPDFRVELKSVFVAGDWAAAESVMTGTDTGDSPLWPGTGKRLSIRAASIIQMQGDRIKRNTTYFDSASLMRQLGGMSDMPSG